jgi:hypothetical protein
LLLLLKQNAFLIQIPSAKERKEDVQNDDVSRDKKNTFPVVDFDPVLCYLSELQESYGDSARFYYGRQGHPAIGVKLERCVVEQTPGRKSEGTKVDFV